MTKLSVQDRAHILSVLSEGVGISATARRTGRGKKTILRLLVAVGRACAEYQDRVMRHLNVTNLEVDGIWSFVGTQKRVHFTSAQEDGPGDYYTFICIDRVTKLVLCWLVGTRSRQCAHDFMGDLASRLAVRVPLLTGRLKVFGDSNWGRFATVHGEEANRPIHMGMRPDTRATNALGRRIRDHVYAVSFFFMVYNFLRVDSTIKTTPAIEAGVSNFVWTMEDIVRLLEH